MLPERERTTVHRASDEAANAEAMKLLRTAAGELNLGQEARSCAIDMFLAKDPGTDRSKPAVVAASLYAGALVTGEERSQTEIADAVGVSRFVVQDRWKGLLEAAGFDPPTW